MKNFPGRSLRAHATFRWLLGILAAATLAFSGAGRIAAQELGGVLEALKAKKAAVAAEAPKAEETKAEKAEGTKAEETKTEAAAAAAAPAPATPPAVAPAAADSAPETGGVAVEAATPAGPPPDAGAASPDPAAKKEPLPPMFWMHDGTRLAGIPDIQEFHVETAYGQLVIPLSEITRVRFALSEKSQMSAELRDLVRQLGHEEYDLREQAMEEIRKAGAQALPLLREALESEDEEVKVRAEKLIEELDEEEEEPDEESIHTVVLKGEEDEIVTLQFTAKGRVLEQSFPVVTRYGRLDFNRKDIVSIVFREPLVKKQAFAVDGSMLAAQNRWLDTGVTIEKGKAIELTASGSITIQNYNVSCGPEGTTQVSSSSLRFESHPTGALVGKVGENGKAFFVGSSYSGKADDKGNLYLAIALNGNNASGQFDVVLEQSTE